MKPKKPVPNSLRLKYQYAKTAANLVNRLPIQSKIDASQDLLVPLAPIWQHWYSRLLGAESTHSSSPKSEQTQDCYLKAINRNILLIACTNASKATLIKNQQTSLLEAIHQKGHSQITRIRVVMELPTQSLSQQIAAKRLTQQHKTVRQRPTNSAIKALESAAKASVSDDLSNALNRLADTLRKS